MKKNNLTYQSELDGLPFHSDITALSRTCRDNGYNLPMSVGFLLHVLRSSMNADNLWCLKKMKTLAAEMGVSEKTVKRAVQFAEKHNLIIVGRAKTTKFHPRKDRYQILYPWQPKNLPLIAKKSERRIEEKNSKAESKKNYVKVNIISEPSTPPETRIVNIGIEPKTPPETQFVRVDIEEPQKIIPTRPEPEPVFFKVINEDQKEKSAKRSTVRRIRT